MKTAIKFFAFLLPFFFVLGCIRVYISPDGKFLPSWNYLVDQFSYMPDFKLMLAQDLAAIGKAGESLGIDYGASIVDMSTFFQAIGSWFTNLFNLLGSFFVLVWNLISLPFKFCVWLFGVVFGLNIP